MIKVGLLTEEQKDKIISEVMHIQRQFAHEFTHANSARLAKVKKKLEEILDKVQNEN